MTRASEFLRRSADILAHPENRRHDFDGLTRCCLHDGALDLALMELHEGIVGPGKCDVTTGMCACGETHPRKN